MIIDAHIHCTGEETIGNVLKALDKAKVDKAILLAPFLTCNYSLDNADSLRKSNKYLSDFIAKNKDRLIGFAVINPSLPGAVDDFYYANELGLSGLKMVPTGWYPYDDCAHKVYEIASFFKTPILFHSGVFIDGKSGRFCRPTFYESIRDYPNLRVTLAHLGWPWTDEANAVGLIDLINGVPPAECQFRFDISFGAPPVYRLEVLKKAISVLTPELLQFGSDIFFPCNENVIKERIEEVINLLQQLNIDQSDQNMIMGETAATWLNIK